MTPVPLAMARRLDDYRRVAMEAQIELQAALLLDPAPGVRRRIERALIAIETGLTGSVESLLPGALHDYGIDDPEVSSSCSTPLTLIGSTSRVTG